MDKQEAKLVLSDKSFADPGRLQQSNDPQVRAALQLLEKDSELADWWETTRASDQLVQEKLGAISPPSDLQASLNASLSSHARQRSAARKVVQWLSIAASIVLVGMIGAHFAIDRTEEFTGPLEQAALGYSMYGPRLTFMNEDGEKLVDWLEARDIDLPAELPPRLLQQEGIGCRPLEWTENGVAILCFNADTVYHLFVGLEEDYPNFKDNPNIEYARPNEGWTLSSWRSGENVMVLAAKTTPDRMQQMLADYSP